MDPLRFTGDLFVEGNIMIIIMAVAAVYLLKTDITIVGEITVVAKDILRIVDIVVSVIEINWRFLRWCWFDFDDFSRLASDSIC